MRQKKKEKKEKKKKEEEEELVPWMSLWENSEKVGQESQDKY